jgi:hypothetical protein
MKAANIKAIGMAKSENGVSHQSKMKMAAYGGVAGENQWLMAVS